MGRVQQFENHWSSSYSIFFRLYAISLDTLVPLKVLCCNYLISSFVYISIGSLTVHLHMSVSPQSFSDAALRFLERMAEELSLPLKKVEVNIVT